jgi:L,D-transpeptidase catalytic domain
MSLGMRLSERSALVAVGFVATFMSALSVLALAYYSDVAHEAADGRPTSQAALLMTMRPSALPEPDDVSRFAYLPTELAPLAVPVPDDGAWETETIEAGLYEDPWSAEIQKDARAFVPRMRSSAASRRGLNRGRAAPISRRKLYSLKERLAVISPSAERRVARKFEAAKAAWPPSEIALVAIKDEKTIELFARSEGEAWQFIDRYAVLAASGGAGPKLQRGDKQVPEGIYRISYLNPNSRYHVSLRVNYPNAFDRKMASADGRKDLGGDIMIHGKNASAGCLAVGDKAAEELFVLAAKVGLSKVKLIIAPTDFRRNGVAVSSANKPEWLPTLYVELASAMSEFKRPPETGLLTLLGF